MKKKLVLSILVLLMGSTLFITENKKINQEIAIEDLENNKSMAIYIKDDNGNYNKATNIPTSGYTLNTTKSVCTNNAKPSWNIKTNSLKISNLTSKDTGCYLYFDKATAKDLILGNATSIKESPEGFTGIADTDEGMFYAEDDDGTTYYFRGAVDNNWFKFANLYWRIIRINGDGSIRMIYNGPTSDQTGETTQIGTSTYNSSDDDNAYVGYMYGTAGSSTYAATHANTNNSTIKTTVDNWYRDNLLNNYDKYISKEVGFCNDRKVVSMSGHLENGIGKEVTAYGPKGRIYNSDNSGYKTMQTPSFKCTTASNDLFTISSSSKGNKKLTYPIGLITADEVIYAGGFGGTDNSSYYLCTNQNYWTMSPYWTNGYYSYVFRIFSNGIISSGSNGLLGVRPVINLSPDVKLIGEGTASNPYQIEGVE